MSPCRTFSHLHILYRLFVEECRSSEKWKLTFCVILCFRREVDENFVPLDYYSASSGNSLPTFRDKLSGRPTLRVKKMALIGCAETS
jgi:hypothetical protein